ncbi:hypothetical protein [Wenzhouxiangella sediminis]|uniref:Uncharacterized protein n=1 Tax=Wenzhouxiangella sediminis TaxID=1792836 RepID=A0A3E1KCE3_9GAMM|nr:hypothetical protein [Wenzhouxiangella sediminis]RFF32575.1 hypothetical protein DZC52_01120 [Wenzhouxiangella sediminis]
MRIIAPVFTLALIGLLTQPIAAQSAAQSEGSTSDSEETASTAAAQAQERPAPGQQLAHWFGKAAAAYERQDIEAWVEATEELHRLRPYNQDFMRHLVEGHARLGNLRQAYDMMLKMQQQGLSENWDQIEAVEPLRQHEIYDHLNRLMSEAGEPFGDTTVWSRLGSDYPMPEAMAVDPASNRVFVGTVRDGLIITSEDGESWTTWASPGEVGELQAVFDLAIDADRDRLWVATGRVPQFQGPEREGDIRSSLLRFNLETGALEAEYPLSTGGGRNLLGSLAVAQDGTVFAADTQAPVVYRLDSPDGQLRPFFGHNSFTSLRGLALNEDGTLLYIADYELGIFVVDATGGQQAWQLGVPETFNAGGVDGLFFWDDHLIAIQNAISPQRVVRLKLGPDGLGATEVAPLAAAKNEFDTPTFGAMDGNALYFFAASHWHHVDAEGKAEGDLPEVPIMKIDVDNASVKVVGEEIMERIQRQREEQRQQQPE